jgi:hypothetical protein
MKFKKNPAGIIIDKSKDEFYLNNGDIIVNYLNIYKHRVKVIDYDNIILYGIKLIKYKKK